MPGEKAGHRLVEGGDSSTAAEGSGTESSLRQTGGQAGWVCGQPPAEVGDKEL